MLPSLHHSQSRVSTATVEMLLASGSGYFLVGSHKLGDGMHAHVGCRLQSTHGQGCCCSRRRQAALLLASKLCSSGSCLRSCGVKLGAPTPHGGGTSAEDGIWTLALSLHGCKQEDSCPCDAVGKRDCDMTTAVTQPHWLPVEGPLYCAPGCLFPHDCHPLGLILSPSVGLIPCPLDCPSNS